MKIGSIILILIVCGAIQGQVTLTGKVLDAGTHEPLLFATVILFQEGKMVAGVQSDFDGNFKLPNLKQGAYDLVAAYLGYDTLKLTGLYIKGEVFKQDLSMWPQDEEGFIRDFSLLDTAKIQKLSITKQDTIIRGPAGGYDRTYYINGIRIGEPILSKKEQRKARRKARREKRLNEKKN